MTKQTNSPKIFVIPVLLAFALILAACASQPAATQASNTSTGISNTGASAPASGSVSFSKDIVPIFQNSCVKCHGGEQTSKALDLKTFASMMAGSQNGAVIVPGNAANSKLVQSVQSGKMPKRGTPLTAQQIQMLVDWVNAGAQNN